MEDTAESDVTLINSVVEATRRGNIKDAEFILADAVTRNPDNPGAWWLWATIVETPELQRLYLRQVLRLAPHHHQARAWLASLIANGEKLTQDLLGAEEKVPSNQPVTLPPRDAAVLSGEEIAMTHPLTGSAPEPLSRQGIDGRLGVRLLAVGYLVALSAAEIIITYFSPQAGIGLHMAVLVLLLIHMGLRHETPDHRLWASIALMPLIRIISLSLPLTNFTLSYWFLFTSIPLFGAAYFVMRLLSLSWEEIGVHRRGLPRQLAVALLGFGLGYAEYLILHPEPLISELTLAQFWWPALILLMSTGFLEELIFRGIFQNTAVEILGRALGITYVALFFAVFHVGYQSIADVIFVLAVGLLFGWIVLRTKSIIGVTLAHGLTNIMLFLIMPFVANGSLLLPF